MDVDKHFALGHNEHFTCTFLPFHHCCSSHLQQVCVCQAAVCMLFVCKLNTASDWLTNSYATLAPPSSLTKENKKQLCSWLRAKSDDNSVIE